jgi:hypothetical protein
LEKLLTEIGNDDISKSVLQTIHKIMINIINNPNDTKFRRMKVSNNTYKTNIEAYSAAMDFLRYARFGFSDDGQFFEFKGDIDYLINILESYDNFLIDKKFVELNFDPYKTSLISTSAPIDEMKKVIKPTDFDELLKEEKRRRNEIIKNSLRTERNTKIINLVGHNLGNVISNLNNEIESDSNSDAQKFLNMIKVKKI